jgi:crotonobetainyl-CoA:carnitine CoA-transferase CaiB-like acyl-CoA transferase
VVTVRDDDDWRRLRSAVGDPDWAQDEDLATTTGRLARRAEIDARLSAWTRQRPPRQVTATLQAEGVPAGFMQRAAEYEDDPQLRARDFLRTFEQRAWSRWPLSTRRFAPS